MAVPTNNNPTPKAALSPALSPRFVGALGVALAAFVAYVFCAAPTAYPLDSAELATAAFGLGVAHPPGEETTLLFAKLVTLLPLGSVTFKVALSQAVAGALAATLVFLLTFDVAQSLSFVRQATGQRTCALAAAAAALAFAYAPGVVIASNRAEVYAVQTALSLAAIGFALQAHQEQDPRRALVAALLIGLGVANHSLVAGLVACGAVAAAFPLWRHSPGRTRFLLLSIAAFAAGLLVHAYLPLRTGALFAAADRGIDNVLWGDARTGSGFWWVVSAKTFAQKAAGVHSNASPWDLPFLPIEELGTIFALLAPAGAYFLLRRQETRVYGTALLLGAAGSMLAALTGGLDPANPDIRGYLGPAIALLAVLSGSAVMLGIALFRVARLRPLLAMLFLAGALTRFPATGMYPDLRNTRAADDYVRGLLAELPVRAALFTNHFETGFLVGYQRFVEGARPDVAWAHLAFAGGPGYAERVSAARPELAATLLALRDDNGATVALTTLDAQRPVRIEADGILAPDIRHALTPAGAFWAPAGHTQTTEIEQVPTWSLAEAMHNRQVRGYLAWRNYIDAAWACELGFSVRASARFAELARLVPEDQRFHELQQHCGQR